MGSQIQSTNPVRAGSGNLLNKSGLAVKIKPAKSSNKAVPDNPNGADKLELSMNSYKEEISLLKSNKQAARIADSARDQLHNSLLRIESVLHQVAATMAFDADSLEAVQQRISSELKGKNHLIKGVKMPEFEGVNLQNIIENPQNVLIKSKQQLSKIKQAVSYTIKTLEEDSAANQADAKDTRREKLLEVAQENTRAALNNYKPQDVFSQAESAAKVLKEQNQENQNPHRGITQSSVIDLVG